MRILFVCTGNTCRSPMAHAYVADRFRRMGRSDLEALSAGVAAWSNSSASEQSISVMSEMGIDLRGFRSTRLTEHLADSVDRIVCMTAGHLQAVLAMGVPPEKLTLLADPQDVPDPFGGDVEVYRRVFSFMKPALDNLTDQLLGEAR